MLTKTQFPGQYIQGYDAIKQLGKQVKNFGQKAYLICDPFVYDKMLGDFQASLADEINIEKEKFHGECSDEEVERISSKVKNVDIIIGIGGGKTLDTAKALAWQLHLPVAIVPTIASTDAPCSALSVIYTPQGQFKRYLILPSNPDIVLVDTKIVCQAPVEFLVAGMGDALATWFEARSCQRASSPNMSGMKGSVSAYTLAKLCYDLLLHYGYEAKCACQANVVTPAFEHIVEANTLLSGLGFESGGLAAAHAIHNGLTVLEQAHDKYHGQKVAFGVLASLILTDSPSDEIDEVYSFCESVGLPTTLEAIGLKDVSQQQLNKAAQAACDAGETIHNEPMPIEAYMVYNALIAADAIGRARLSPVFD